MGFGNQYKKTSRREELSAHCNDLYFLGVTEHFSGKNETVRWIILVRKQKRYMQNDLKGKENYFELLNGRFELWTGFELQGVGCSNEHPKTT